MIEKVIAHSRTVEVDATLSKILASYHWSALTDDTYLSGIIFELKVMSAKLSESIKRIQYESDLEEKDHIRNEAVRGLYYLVLGSTYFPEGSIKKAAQKVIEVLNNYVLHLDSDSYDIESSLLISMISELDSPVLQKEIALLSGVSEMIGAIKSAQNEFEISVLNYELNKKKNNALENATTLKRQLIRLINNKLIVYLNAMAIVDIATYGDILRVISHIIAGNNDRVKRRLKMQEIKMQEVKMQV